MLFGPKRKIRQIKNFYVKCYEHVITSTEVVKYLGVHIDKYLNFENIVSNIVSKVNGRLKFLYRNAKCLVQFPLLFIYKQEQSEGIIHFQ